MGPHPEEPTCQATTCTSQSWVPAWRDKPPWLPEDHWDRQKGWWSLDSMHEECVCAGLPAVKAARALFWKQLARCTSHSEQGEHWRRAHSTPQPAPRSEPWEMTQSSYAETDQGVWTVIRWVAAASVHAHRSTQWFLSQQQYPSSPQLHTAT